MPWEITIRRPDGQSLGDVPAVLEQIQAAVPETQFYREPSGAERVAAARARGIEFPEIVRRGLESRPARFRAAYEGGGLSVLLYGFEADPLVGIHAEVRGDGNPVPVIAALCRPNGWEAIDDATGRPVELGGAAAAGWEAFRAFRERAADGPQAPDGGVPEGD